MEVEEHNLRLEVLQLQKEYELKRIEQQQQFHQEKLQQMRQLYSIQIQLAKKELKDNSTSDLCG